MRKTAFISAILFASITNAQTEKTDSKLTMGFNLGMSYSNIQAKKSNAVNDINVSNGAGFELGILIDYKLNKKISFTPKAELNFSEGKISILKNDGDNNMYYIYPFNVDICSHFTYTFLPNKKISPYLILGPSFKTPFSDETKSSDIKRSSQITSASNVAIDFGFGFNKKLTYYNISPEIRYSYGLINLKNKSDIQNLNYHSISLILNFKE